MKPDQKPDEQAPVPIHEVLVVDDVDNSKEIRQVLEKEGFRARLAVDGGQARTMAGTYKPDLIILELALPRESGYELCDFFKKRTDDVPLLVLTEVDLDSSRNLAIWCGADAYLVKPVSTKTLVKIIRDVADVVWQRNRAKPKASEGVLEFPCNCGQKVAVNIVNAGKATYCPRCSSLLIIPKNVNNWEGFWKSSPHDKDSKGAPKQPAPGAEGQGESDDHLADFCCHLCGAMIQLKDYEGGGKVPCSECGEPHVIPKRIISQIKFFFTPREREQGTIRFNPTKGISLRCDQCHENFAVNAEQLSLNQLVCPNCREPQKSPSIRDSPISRAALASTGRLFTLNSGDQKGMKFLLPPDSIVKLGTDQHCAFRLEAPGVEPVHCAMKYTMQGVVLQDAGSKSGTFVNENRISKTVLTAGDEVRIGSVRLKLAGNRSLNEEDVFRSNKQKDDPAQPAGVTTNKIGEQAAKILQLHWEKQREVFKTQAKIRKAEAAKAAQLAAEAQAKADAEARAASPGEPSVAAHGWYQYGVDPQTGEPLYAQYDPSQMTQVDPQMWAQWQAAYQNYAAAQLQAQQSGIPLDPQQEQAWAEYLHWMQAYGYSQPQTGISSGDGTFQNLQNP